MSIPLDSHFIPAFSIEDVLLDRDTGAPLSGGLVYFEQDNQRGTPKNVYQITGTSPNYSFIQLPNPMTLSSIGTFVDSLDNPVIPYFYPYDSAGNVELYYVRVTSSTDVPQFTREAVPYIPDSGSSSVSSAFVNEISNPQFSEVLFIPPTKVFSYNAASLVVTPIAPGWDLVVSSAAAATVTVTQLTPAGSLNRPSNPGTILEISSTGVSRLRLRQRIFGSPNLWGSGYITGSFVAKTYSGTSVALTMYYSQSNGTVTNLPIVTGTLLGDGLYATHTGSVLVPASTSTQFYPNAYIDIEFDIPLSVQIDLTSVQIAHTGDVSLDTITYDQQSNDRQIDHLFHYYKPQLDYKPIPSYLVGWDFPMNPAQLPFTGTYGSIPATATGANGAYYAWDQTIIFQTVDASLTVQRSNIPAMQVQAVTGTQFALVQYLEASKAMEIILDSYMYGLSVNARCESTVAQNVTISLWKTTNVSLPTLPSSLVTGLDANGFPTVVAGWTEIPRGTLGNAQFTTTSSLVDYGFSGWQTALATDSQTATFFAIVVGTNAILAPNVFQFVSVSLVPGQIPTIPAPQTRDAVMRECSRYYQKSFATNISPAGGVGFANAAACNQNVGAGVAGTLGPVVSFPVEMRTTPTVTLYNPQTAGSFQIYNASNAVAWTSSLPGASLGNKGFNTTGTTGGGSFANAISYVHWTANAQLGVV
jgi:hypothetical protein